MERRAHFLVCGLAALLMWGLAACVSRSRTALVVKAEPTVAHAKLSQFSAETGGSPQAPSSVILGHTLGNPRFIICDRGQYLNSLPSHTEVEVVPYRKVQTLLRARTGGAVNSSLVSGDLARESEVLRMCADYIERGLKPAGQQVIPFELWQQQTRTNQFAPPAHTPDWAKPELKLK
jgi:hypothetical protein